MHARVEGVTRVYPGSGGQPPVNALGPVDLDLYKGEFLSIVGPSGCGKSTFLELLAGLAEPTAGTIEFEGRAVRGQVPEGVGVVFQEDSSFPWLTVWDNVAFGLENEGVNHRRKSKHALILPLVSWASRILRSPIPRSFRAACASACASLARLFCSLA